MGLDARRHGREGVIEADPGRIEEGRGVPKLLGDVDSRGVLVGAGLAHHPISESLERHVDLGTDR